MLNLFFLFYSKKRKMFRDIFIKIGFENKVVELKSYVFVNKFEEGGSRFSVMTNATFKYDSCMSLILLAELIWLTY